MMASSRQYRMRLDRAAAANEGSNDFVYNLCPSEHTALLEQVSRNHWGLACWYSILSSERCEGGPGLAYYVHSIALPGDPSSFLDGFCWAFSGSEDYLGRTAA